jgi:replicative DNA helicase
MQLIRSTQVSDYQEIPKAVEMEQSILGSLMVDKSAMAKIADMIVADDFYQPEHRLMFAAARRLYDANAPIDVLSIAQELKEADQLADAGGRQYLIDVSMSISSTWAIRHHAEIVKGKAILRNASKLGRTLDELSLSGANAAEVLQRGQELLTELARRQTIVKSPRACDHVDRILEEIEQRDPNEMTGLPTAFKELNEKLDGLQKGELIVVAGRPSMGKSAFAGELAQYAAIEQHKTVFLFSLESSQDQVITRMLASLGTYPYRALRKNQNATARGLEPVRKAKEKINRSELYIFDRQHDINTATKIHAHVRRLIAEGVTPDLIAVDHCQYIWHDEKNPLPIEISKLTKMLAALAQELNIPVVLLSQVPREVEQRKDKRPHMSDLAQSGTIEQDANTVIFLYRDEYYDPDTEKPGVCEIIIAKCRDGETGTIELFWRGEYVSFYDRDDAPYTGNEKYHSKRVVAGAPPEESCEPEEPLELDFDAIKELREANMGNYEIRDMETGRIGYQDPSGDRWLVPSIEACKKNLREQMAAGRTQADVFASMYEWIDEQASKSLARGRWADATVNNMHAAWKQLQAEQKASQPILFGQTPPPAAVPTVNLFGK